MTRVYSVPTISCDHCKRTIEAAAGDVEGVTAAVVDIAAKTVEVRGQADPGLVRAAIEASGYKVVDLSDA